MKNPTHMLEISKRKKKRSTLSGVEKERNKMLQNRGWHTERNKCKQQTKKPQDQKEST